jgi:radical SAM protein with 4Fe4S-binding SPASM domain
VLRAALGLANGHACGCGLSTIRVTPGGRVLPCVYWPGAGEPLCRLLELGEAILETPDFVACRQAAEHCGACGSAAWCGGGCAGRRAALGRPGAPDPYCPSRRGPAPPLEFRLAPHRELVKVGSACTTVFATR